MDHFTQNELDHLFIALILHTKMSRAEQARWVGERAEIWRKIVAASEGSPSEETTYRTKLFESPECLRRFWKDPDEIRKAFPRAVKPKVKAAP
jgi:hypothetical protein